LLFVAVLALGWLPQVALAQHGGMHGRLWRMVPRMRRRLLDFMDGEEILRRPLWI